MNMSSRRPSIPSKLPFFRQNLVPLVVTAIEQKAMIGLYSHKVMRTSLERPNGVIKTCPPTCI